MAIGKSYLEGVVEVVGEHTESSEAFSLVPSCDDNLLVHRNIHPVEPSSVIKHIDVSEIHLEVSNRQLGLVQQRPINNLERPRPLGIVDNKHIDIGIETVLRAHSVGEITPQKVMVAALRVGVLEHSPTGHTIKLHVHFGVDVVGHDSTRIQVDVDEAVLEFFAGFAIELQHAVDYDEVLRWE